MSAPDTPPPPLYLIDGSGFIFRAFHGLPLMTRADGTPVNAVLGFVNMLIRLLADLKAERLVVVFDAKRENFRNRIYPDYKAHRPEPPEELRPQFPLIREAVAAFAVPCVELEGYEADDLIATYARQARASGETVVVVSSDKDLMQLVGDGIRLLDPLKNRTIGPDEVFEKFGVPPDKVVDVQALAGDSTDNVPGVPGIGIKTAAQLITEYGDLDTLLARAGEIRQPKRRDSLLNFADQARISRQLVRLDDQAPLPLPLAALRIGPLETGILRAFLEQQGFRSVLARLPALHSTAGTAPPPALRPTPVFESPPESAALLASPPSVPSAGIISTHYELIQTADALIPWIAAATETGFVAFDTETDSLTPCTARLVGVSLATMAGHACYIPLAHVMPGNAPGGLELSGAAPPQILLADAITLLRPLLEDPSVLKIAHNAKFDLQVLAQHGITVSPIDDTMLISYVLDGGRHGHGMDELSGLHLHHQTITFEEVCGSGKARITFDQVPLDRALAYAAEDADITLRLWQVLKPRLITEQQMTLYETIERPLVPVIAAMESAGILVDRTALAALSRDFQGRLATLEAEIHQLAGRSFNVGSPKQLGEVLFEEMQLNSGGSRKGKTGAWSTDSAVLEPLAEQGHTIAQRVLDWRQLAKLKGTYTDALPEQIAKRTGRVHTSFAMALTNTGRLSSSDPNLQNIPVRTEEGRNIRRAFIAAPGQRLISVDYSQIELRLIAEIADIPALKVAFRDGVDIHALTASRVFGVPLEQMTSELRRQAKAINFGIIYGISGFGLARQLGITPGEANMFIKQYFERFPELRAYMEQARDTARRQGYVTTLFGRRCIIPGIHDKNAARRAFAERQAINAPIQGSAADIIKRAMVRLPAAAIPARLLLQVHDELLFEAAEADVDTAASRIRMVMEGAATLSVPLVADVGVGQSWAEAH